MVSGSIARDNDTWNHITISYSNTLDWKFYREVNADSATITVPDPNLNY